MRNIKLLTGVAIVALLAGASSAWADSVKMDISQDISQDTANNKPVTNIGIIEQASLTGKGAASSVSANGAVSSVNVSNISDNTQSVNVAGKARNITQETSNNAAITNAGLILSGPVTGHGASVTVSATGAASVVSVSSIK